MNTQELIALQNSISSSYDSLIDAKSRLIGATELVIECEEQIEVAKVGLLASGAIDGKNEDARKAQIKTKLAPQYAQLATLERTQRRARVDAELALLEVERNKQLMRIAELLPFVESLDEPDVEGIDIFEEGAVE